MAKRSKRKEEAIREATRKSRRIVATRPGEAAWLHSTWFWAMVLVALVVLAYQPVWHAGYIWDDDSVVINNPCIAGPLGVKEIWTTSAADICPLTLTTFWLEHAWWGVKPLPYHLVNVALHAACAVVLWRVLLGLQVPGAWLGAALWALHPVQVESVAWITEMKNTESGLFYILAIFYWIRHLKKPGSTENYGLTLFFAALAMAAKSSTVVLPVVLVLCAWWMEGKWQWRNLLSNLVKVVPIFLMSLASSVASVLTQSVRANDAQWARSWPERLVTAGDAVWFYLGKLLWPHPLSMVYPRWQMNPSHLISYLELFTVLLVTAVLWIKRNSWSRPYLMAWLYFLVTLLPVLGLINNTFSRYSFVADHFQYLADMAPLALLGAGLFHLSNTVFRERAMLRPILPAVVALMLGALSWQRTWVYEGEETLWTDTLAKNPNCWAGHNNLGLVLADKGRLDEAISHYQRSLDLNPLYTKAHTNLGTALVQTGRAEEGISHFRRAIELNPKDVQPRNNLGNTLAQQGRIDEALAELEKALEIDPHDPEVRYNLGTAYVLKGETDEAIANFEKALEIDPDYFEAHYNLGTVLLQKGHPAEAAVHFQEAARLNPGFSAARENLAKAQAMARQEAGQK